MCILCFDIDICIFLVKCVLKSAFDVDIFRTLKKNDVENSVKLV